MPTYVEAYTYTVNFFYFSAMACFSCPLLFRKYFRSKVNDMLKYFNKVRLTKQKPI